MITIHAIRKALNSADPFVQMDELVRAELNTGRSARGVFDEIKSLVDDVLSTPQLTSDAEEAFLGILDSLTRNCHEDCQYKDLTPTKNGWPDHTAASKSV